MPHMYMRCIETICLWHGRVCAAAASRAPSADACCVSVWSQVLDGTSLWRDMQSWVDHDATMIGERGACYKAEREITDVDADFGR